MARYVHAMSPTLSNLELDILRKLVNGEAVSLSSQLRIRLELVGAIREGARRVTVTEMGKRLTRQERAIVAKDSPSPAPKVARDGRGRRKPFQRRSVF